MKVGDLVRGSKDNIEAQRESVALIIDKDDDGKFTLCWISGRVKSRKIRYNFSPSELEVISEGR